MNYTPLIHYQNSIFDYIYMYCTFSGNCVTRVR